MSNETVKGKFKIRLYPAIAKDAFKLSKLVPDKNNVRRALFAEEVLPATPHYNTSIVEDKFMYDHLSALHGTVLACPSFAEAIMLMKAWLAQRNRLAHSHRATG